jgi:hypothetical protein
MGRMPAIEHMAHGHSRLEAKPRAPALIKGKDLHPVGRPLQLLRPKADMHLLPFNLMYIG